MTAMSQSPHAEHFIERLDLDRIDRDIFVGRCHAGSPLRAFGGQVAAQALIAAGRTVDEPDRRVHSLHAYFIRPGRTQDPIVYSVQRVRDGRTFTTRHITAVQYGETIFTMSASFSINEPTLSHQAPAPDVPRPDDVPQTDFLYDGAELRTPDQGYPTKALLERKLVDPESVAQATGGTATRVAWTRTLERLPDDPLVHVCTLTYFSDLTLIGAILEPHGGRAAHPELALSSLDHAMWFHAPFRADEWTMFVLDSPVASRGHGLARGEFYREDGTLIASVVQEALLRKRS